MTNNFRFVGAHVVTLAVLLHLTNCRCITIIIIIIIIKQTGL